MKPTVALINDTSLFENHFGCTLVGQTFREQFARTGLELKYAFPRQFSLDEIAPYLSSVDLVVVNGEGSIHHDRNLHLLEIAKRFPSVLLNTVYQDNRPNDALKHFLYRSARESLSAGAVQDNGLSCDCVPDAIFASSQLRSFVKPKADIDIGFTDSVLKKRIKVGPLSLYRKTYGFGPQGTVADYLVKLSRHKRICIGRFHAVVAASVLGIPYSCWESNTWKISGLMHDMGVGEYFYPSFDEARMHVPAEFDPRIRQFSEEAVLRIERMFDHVADLAAIQGNGRNGSGASVRRRSSRPEENEAKEAYPGGHALVR